MELREEQTYKDAPLRATSFPCEYCQRLTETKHTVTAKHGRFWIIFCSSTCYNRWTSYHRNDGKCCERGGDVYIPILARI